MLYPIFLNKVLVHFYCPSHMEGNKSVEMAKKENVRRESPGLQPNFEKLGKLK